MAHHARSFQLAARFLPEQAADEAAVVYAFCRLVDDTADEAPDLQTARSGLNDLSADLASPAPEEPAVSAYRTIATRRDIPLQVAEDLVAGVGSDLEAVRISDDDAFILYCYQVAGTVGLMMCGVLGVSARDAWPYAISLGVAMQITNICRDVLEDARRDRVYLPASRLAAAGLSPQDILDETVDRKRLAGVVDGMLDLADEHYQFAEEGMRFIPWRARLAILIASRVYGGIGVRLRRHHGSDPMHGRTITTKLEKAWWVWMGVLAFFKPTVLGWTVGQRSEPDTLRAVPLLQETA